ncbi:acetone carboxylase subunit gamma [Chloroflexota bacterium]
MKIRVTEYLDINLESELWSCNRCDNKLGSARENYKEHCLVSERDPREIHNPFIDSAPGGCILSPDPEWCRLLEFYCPNCATMLETEYLPPGHPITHDLEIDVDALKAKYATGKECE